MIAMTLLLELMLIFNITYNGSSYTLNQPLLTRKFKQGIHFMKKYILLFCLMFLFLLAGCSSISKTESEKLIVEEYSNHLGTAKTISTKKENDDYYIEWENKEDKYRGTSKVSSDGEIPIIYAEIE